MAFKLPSLPYAADALEPHIDAKTMEIHHGKHHNGYTAKLNAAIDGTELESKSIEEILGNLDMSNAAVRNNGGGYYNHCLFWEIMGPNSTEMSSELSDAIEAGFGSFNAFNFISSLYIVKNEKSSAISSDAVDLEYSVKKPLVLSKRFKPSLSEQVEHLAYLKPILLNLLQSL